MHASLADISKESWQQLENPHFPFTDYDHLLALETTRCVGQHAGWIPFYLTLHTGTTCLGATFFYVKNNSYGEFIFDHQWANAFAQNGLAYYPKIVSAIPFTPATGPKILVHPDASSAEVHAQLIKGTLGIMEKLGCSSTHFLFVPKETMSAYQEAGLLVRHSYQFHWKNRGYANFDDFLAALKGKRRRQIQLERRQLAQEGLQIEVLTGDQLTPAHAAIMFEFYQQTNEKNWSKVCLTKEYFDFVMCSMRTRTVLMVAKRDSAILAAAINFRKGDCMYGRYWGTRAEVRNLHFELCYYQAIEYAITHKLRLYEAGAQGIHKVPRGFVPEITLSAHAIRHPAFRQAIGRFVEEEKIALAAEFEEYVPHLPYK